MTSRPRFHELDLLRGAACAMVLGFHFLHRGQRSHWLTDLAPAWLSGIARYGNLGVHLFFILSGFVIFMSAEGATVRQFAASRAARLYPAFWVASVITAATAWALASTTFDVTLWTLVVNLTMVPQWFDVPYVDGSYWSLAVELQFYLLIGLMLALRWSAHIERLMFGWLVLCLVDLFRPMWRLEFWAAINWAQYFCLGITCYLVRRGGLTTSRVVLLLCSYALILAGWLTRLPAADQPWEQVFAPALIVSGFVLVFVGIALGHWRAPPMRFGALAGALTYPVYVLHENVGYLLIEQLKPTGWPFLLRVALVVTLLLLVCWHIHLRIEKPWGHRLRRWIEGDATQRATITVAAS